MVKISNIVRKLAKFKVLKEETILNVNDEHFNNLAVSGYSRKLYKYLIAFSQ